MRRSSFAGAGRAGAAFKRDAARRVGFFLLPALLAAAALYRPDEHVAGPAEVIDGDSIRVGGRELRLEGIDAPELHQMCQAEGRSYACGRLARGVLVEKIGAGPLDCRVTGRDKYGRGLALCRVGQQDLNASLVRDGSAVSFGLYLAEEREAQAARRGLWAGSFERPSEWRKIHPR